MVPGRLFQLRLKAFLKEPKGVVFVFVVKDPCESKGFSRAKVKDYVLYLHSCSSSSHFLIIDFEGTVPEDFTFPLIISFSI